jgi:hypothetical protein
MENNNIKNNIIDCPDGVITTDCSKECKTFAHLIIPEQSVKSIKYNSNISTSCRASDSIGSIYSIQINEDAQIIPKFTITNGNLQYRDSSNQYVDFDQSHYINVDVQAYHKVYDCSSAYLIIVKPIKCNEDMIIGDMTLSPYKKYYLKNVSNDGLHLEIYNKHHMFDDISASSQIINDLYSNIPII